MRIYRIWGGEIILGMPSQICCFDAGHKGKKPHRRTYIPLCRICPLQPPCGPPPGGIGPFDAAAFRHSTERAFPKGPNNHLTLLQGFRASQGLWGI